MKKPWTVVYLRGDQRKQVAYTTEENARREVEKHNAHWSEYPRCWAYYGRRVA
jgi:hypothetical protein